MISVQSALPRAGNEVRSVESGRTPAAPDVPVMSQCCALLDRSLREIELRIGQQRALVNALRGEQDGGAEALICPLIDCDRIKVLRAALADAVAVLEETKQSFKSRQLEALRRRLMDVLASS